ncbi:glycosyltransferase family 9 protein [Agromyces sp. GXS1127]|uniref:glycosyltransferase family 9 protein n=1 Tax=Agromyces sp. GXS1127 TaxID=3424181 RepID=UPI003D3105FD
MMGVRTERVLVARLDSLGDLLLCGPAIRAIAARAEVHLLCGPRGAAAARMLPGVASVHVWDAPWIASPPPVASRGHLEELAGILAEVRADAAVVLTSFHQSPLPLALQLRLAGVPRVTGASVDYAGSLLDVRLKPGEDFPESQSEVVRALTIAAAAGYELPEGDDGRLAVEPPPERSPDLSELPERYVAVHPGAAVGARAWPPANHRDLVRRLAERDVPVVVTGGPDERELTASVAADLAVDLGGRTPLPDLARVLRQADVVVAGNTGAAHLAAAVRTPIVSLFSPVVDERCWRPYGVPVVLFGRTDVACAGTRARDCPVPGHPCLADVSAPAVADAVLALRPADAARAVPAETGSRRAEAVPA